MKSKISLILAASALILSVLACTVSPRPTRTPVVNPPTQPPVTQPPSDAIQIVSTTSFTDQYGYFYIVGEIVNNSEVALNYIELQVQAQDANGNSVLKDMDGNPIEFDTIYPILSVLQPGGSSPFAYYFDTQTYGVPSTYDVQVSSYETTDIQAAEWGVENVQMIDGGDGYLYLSGELVNKTSQWIYIEDLAGGALDDSDKVLSADEVLDYASLLAPAGDSEGLDRTPFAISFPYPPGDVTQWGVWGSVQVYDGTDPYTSLDPVVNFMYFDDYGAIHMVGYVTNTGSETVHTAVVGGFYAEDGTCLDASFTSLPYSVQPGQSVPFDISYFSNVNYNEEQANLIDTFTVQLDYWSTYAPIYNEVMLTSPDVTVEKDGASWTVSGTFTNSSDKNLVDVVVVVTVYEGENLVGVGYAYVYPATDYYAPSATDAFEINLFLDPTLDLTNSQIEVTVVGEFE